MPPRTPAPGARAVVVADLSPNGVVRIEGEDWSAVTTGAEAAVGTQVEVVERVGLRLVVRPCEEVPRAPGAAPPPDALTPLTPREREVATLVARGLTNRQIAAELVVAETTVDRHVSHILGKLGFAGRAQVAAWVARHEHSTPSAE